LNSYHQKITALAMGDWLGPFGKSSTYFLVRLPPNKCHSVTRTASGIFEAQAIRNKQIEKVFQLSLMPVRKYITPTTASGASIVNAIKRARVRPILTRILGELA